MPLDDPAELYEDISRKARTIMDSFERTNYNLAELADLRLDLVELADYFGQNPAFFAQHKEEIAQLILEIAHYEGGSFEKRAQEEVAEFRRAVCCS